MQFRSAYTVDTLILRVAECLCCLLIPENMENPTQIKINWNSQFALVNAKPNRFWGAICRRPFDFCIHSSNVYTK